jgi:hypothetical protein
VCHVPPIGWRPDADADDIKVQEESSSQVMEAISLTSPQRYFHTEESSHNDRLENMRWSWGPRTDNPNPELSSELPGALRRTSSGMFSPCLGAARQGNSTAAHSVATSDTGLRVVLSAMQPGPAHTKIDREALSDALETPSAPRPSGRSLGF